MDILRQTYAVKRAIDELEGVLLEGHLKGCIRADIVDGRDGDGGQFRQRPSGKDHDTDLYFP